MAREVFDPTDPESIELMFVAAQQHGLESAMEHEVGDLQSMLWACWGLMTPVQRELFWQAERVVDLYDTPEFEGVARAAGHVFADESR